MTLKQNIFIFIIFILAFAQCKKDDNTPILVINVDTEYLVDFKEVLTPDENKLTMTISSTNKYDCNDLEIINDVTLDLDNKFIEILLKGIDLPENCGEGEFVPAFEVPLDNLSYSTFNFHLNLNNVLVNEEKITHLADRYFVSFPDVNGVQIVHNDIKKIPKDIVWGEISVDDALGDAALEDIEDMLFNSSGNSAGTNYLADGYYSYFNIVDNLVEMISPTPNNLGLHKQIKFKVSDFPSFNNKINDLRSSYGSHIILELYNGKGETL